ncbi:MAG: hypothetical protein FP816_01860 [Desulfobacteraceae bacterium]|nr:hypothetical protein [Desulfobacteraceae bacterium]
MDIATCQELTPGDIQKNLKFCMFLPFGKAGELEILRYQGIAVDDSIFTLDALTLKPSSFCNVGVKLNVAGQIRLAIVVKHRCECNRNPIK